MSCIVSSRKNSVHSIPRRLLDPRRPKRKPTSQEVEEMLVQYDPVIPEDGRLVLSHYYEVCLRHGSHSGLADGINRWLTCVR